MRKLICQLGNITYNNIGVAIFEAANGVSVREYNIITNKQYSKRSFNTIEDAKIWFSNFNGNDIQKLIAALDDLNDIY